MPHHTSSQKVKSCPLQSPGIEEDGIIHNNNLEPKATPKALETEEVQLEEGEFWVPQSEGNAPPGYGLEHAVQTFKHFLKHSLYLRKLTKNKPPKRVDQTKQKTTDHSTRQTSESLVQLTKESLQIGKLWGLKNVIENEKPAKSRITKTLKKSNKRGTTHQRSHQIVIIAWRYHTRRNEISGDERDTRHQSMCV